mgnify:CR=1 FL=1
MRIFYWHASVFILCTSQIQSMQQSTLLAIPTTGTSALNDNTKHHVSGSSSKHDVVQQALIDSLLLRFQTKPNSLLEEEIRRLASNEKQDDTSTTTTTTTNNNKQDEDSKIRSMHTALEAGTRVLSKKVLSFFKADADPGFIFSQSETLALEILSSLDRFDETLEKLSYYRNVQTMACELLELSSVWEEFSWTSAGVEMSKKPGFEQFILFVSDGIFSQVSRNVTTMFNPIGRLMETALSIEKKIKQSKNCNINLLFHMRKTVEVALRVLHKVIKSTTSENTLQDTKHEHRTVKRGAMQVQRCLKSAFDRAKNTIQPKTSSEIVGEDNSKEFAERLFRRLFRVLQFMVLFQA